MCSEFPPPCSVITPEYTPATGADPESATVTTVEAPAAKIKLGGVTVTDTPLLIPAGVTPNEKFALAAPEFLMVSCRVIGSAVPALIEPKETVAGSEVTVAATAASAASMPAPSQRTSTKSPESSCVTCVE